MRLAAFVDFVHALAMVLWIGGIPLLFWHRWPRLSRAYAYYALAFIVISQLSHYLLGECFLTSLSRWLWQSSPAHPEEAPHTWFTVRFAEAVFHLRPTERSIVIAWEVLVVVCGVGFFVHLRRGRRSRHADTPSRLARDQNRRRERLASGARPH